MMIAGRNSVGSSMKVKRSGTVKGEFALKAVGEALDPLVAQLHKNDLGGKEGKTPKPKKERTEAEQQSKNLAMDIKACPDAITKKHFPH